MKSGVKRKWTCTYDDLCEHHAHVLKSEQESSAVLDKSSVKRKTAETSISKYLSHSKTIFSVAINVNDLNLEGTELLCNGKRKRGDLAVYKNLGWSRIVEGLYQEAGNINEILWTQGCVITALVDRHSLVLELESKLSRIRQVPVGGCNNMCIMATVTSAAGSMEETLSTLDYA